MTGSDSPPAVSVIVVNWNTRDLLACCLGRLVAQLHLPTDPADRSYPAEQPSADVFVVDNASNDDSAELVRERFPAVQLIANPTNVGFARANNQAIRASTGRYVLLLNPDSETSAGAVETLVQFMDQHGEAGAAGSRLVDGTGALQTSCSPFPSLRRELWRLFHLDALWPYARYAMHRWDLDRARPVDVAQGACLIIRRAALEAIGLLDEAYFIYSEEVDLCHRLRQRGWLTFWVPSATVLHHGGQSTRQVAAAMFLHLYRGKVLYFRKRRGPVAARLYKLILLAATAARLALSPFALLETEPRRGHHLALAGHYRRLLRAVPGW